jgi:dipeptidyl aminopeptidase/acylaminoacyl peptidase
MRNTVRTISTATLLAIALVFASAVPSTSAQTKVAVKTEGRVVNGALVTEGVPPIEPQVNDTLLRYQNARSAGFASWTPSGGMLIFTRFGETAQIHRVDGPLAMRRQLTFFAEPVTQGGYASGADSGGFLFAKDTGGDENYQIYYHRDADGAIVQLSEPGTRSTDPAWSRDGKRVAWSVSNSKNGIYQIWMAEVARPESRRKVFEQEGFFSPIDWSPSGDTLLLGNYVSVVESRLYLLELASGKLQQINPSKEPIAYRGGQFSPDGKVLYYISDEGSEFQRLMAHDLGADKKSVLSGDISWDVEFFDLSADGARVAFAVNEGGASRVFVRSVADAKDLPAPTLPAAEGYALAFDRTGDRLAIGMATSQSAGDVWVYSLSSQKLERWTDSELGGLDPKAFIEPVISSYPSFDKVDGKPRQIPFFYYMPKGKGPFPVIISIHGGPEGQERPSFAPIWQYWLNELGIAVVVPNVRGSVGYGKSFVQLDNGMKRMDSVRDIGALLDWIGLQPNLDAKKVVVYGGSYGGFMVNASMVEYADRIAAGVSIVGISSFVTFLQNTSGYRQDLRRVEYGDERDPEMRKFQEKIAPLANATKIRKPMFFIHGANDPRVPVSEAEQLFDAVKANKQTAWMMIATDEGHGFRKKSNRDAMNAAVATFLREVLKGAK